MYLVETWNRNLKKNGQNLYGEKPVELPESELYVIYTGSKKINKSLISLSEEFYGGKETAIDAKVHIITESGSSGIIYQYIMFCKILDQQRALCKDLRAAIEQTLQICVSKDILRKYLEDRREEVVDIMLTLFSQEEVIRMTNEDFRRQGLQEGMQEGMQKGEDRFGQLVTLLMQNGKISEIETIAKDRSLREKYYKNYRIE